MSAFAFFKKQNLNVVKKITLLSIENVLHNIHKLWSPKTKSLLGQFNVEYSLDDHGFSLCYHSPYRPLTHYRPRRLARFQPQKIRLKTFCYEIV